MEILDILLGAVIIFMLVVALVSLILMAITTTVNEFHDIERKKMELQEEKERLERRRKS